MQEKQKYGTIQLMISEILYTLDSKYLRTFRLNFSQNYHVNLNTYCIQKIRLYGVGLVFNLIITTEVPGSISSYTLDIFLGV